MSLKQNYDERKKEVNDYFDFLRRVEQLDDPNPIRVSPEQQKILFSNVYILLYNLIESTIVGCCKELEHGLSHHKVSDILQFNFELRNQWIKTTSRISANEKKRLSGIYNLFEKLTNTTTSLELIFRMKKGGNLDDMKISELLKEFGIVLDLPKPLHTEVCKHRLDGKGILQAIRHIRNQLAHGEKSFIECGSNIGLLDLNDYAKIVFLYLEHVIGRIENYIVNKEYMTVTP